MVEKREYGFSRFLEEVSKKPNTRRSYSLALRKFLDFVYGPGGDYDLLSHRYLDEARNERDAMTDLSKFSDLLEEKASTTKGTYVVVVGRWLKINKIDLDLLLVRKYKGEREVTTKDRPIKFEEAEKVMSHISYRHRLATLILLNSGCRISEVIGKDSIRLQDVDFSTNPVTINIRQKITKTKHARLTFIDGYTAKYLQEYVKENDIQPDQQIFDMHLSTYQQAFRKACIQAGLVERDVNTKRFKIHPYSLRKAFATSWNANIEARELLMGHSLGVKGAYVKPSDEALADEYVKSLESRLDAEKQRELRELREEERQRQSGELEAMKLEMRSLKADFESIMRALKEVKE
jgi:integrase